MSEATNIPIDAWVLQVYMRDKGCYLWIGPSIELYGGFAAFVGYILKNFLTADNGKIANVI